MSLFLNYRSRKANLQTTFTDRHSPVGPGAYGSNGIFFQGGELFLSCHLSLVLTRDAFISVSLNIRSLCASEGCRNQMSISIGVLLMIMLMSVLYICSGEDVVGFKYTLLADSLKVFPFRLCLGQPCPDWTLQRHKHKRKRENNAGLCYSYGYVKLCFFQRVF